MVNEKPGTGETPLEKLLAMVFACWYLASILPVILAYVSDDKTAKQVTILCPLVYHVMISINAFRIMGSWNVCNPEFVSHNGVGIIHAFLGVICVVIYRS